MDPPFRGSNNTKDDDKRKSVVIEALISITIKVNAFGITKIINTIAKLIDSFAKRVIY